MIKKSRIAMMLVVSLVMAGGAALLAMSWLQDRSAPKEAQGSGVAVAALAIPFGTKVDATHVRVVRMPAELVPTGSISTVEDSIGRVASQTIYPGEILMRERLVDHLGGSALAAIVEKGKRAITVRVDDVVGVAGFLLPGNRVDVVATERKGNSRMVVPETILSDLKVLAVDQIASPDKNQPVIVRAVTLEVTPPEAEKVVKATQQGKVQLTLRNPLDEAKVQQAAFEVPAPPKATPKPKAKRTIVRPRDTRITVIRGVEVSDTKVKD